MRCGSFPDGSAPPLLAPSVPQRLRVAAGRQVIRGVARLINAARKEGNSRSGEIAAGHSTWGMCPTPRTDAAARGNNQRVLNGAQATPVTEFPIRSGWATGFRAAAVADFPPPISGRTAAPGRQFDGGLSITAPLCGCPADSQGVIDALSGGQRAVA